MQRARSGLSTSQTGVAPLYILTNALCAALLVWVPYTILVEFSMLLSARPHISLKLPQSSARVSSCSHILLLDSWRQTHR